MDRPGVRTTLTLVAAGAAALFGVADGAAAQTANVAGAWALEVSTDQGVTTPSLTLVQDGEQLTGSYSSETLGEADVTGTVMGSEIEVSFSAELQGQAIPVVYKGTIDEDGRISGTIDLAGGMLTGTFTATRSDG